MYTQLGDFRLKTGGMTPPPFEKSQKIAENPQFRHNG